MPIKLDSPPEASNHRSRIQRSFSIRSVCKMSPTPVQLIGAWASPFVLRARVALNLKGIQYEFLEEQFGAKSDLLLKSNPVHKKIPVLLHDGRPICESLIIVQYLDEAWPDSGAAILPADPYRRAIHRFWAAYVDDKFMPAYHGLLRGPTAEAKAASAEQVAAAVAHLEGAFAECGQGGPFFGGESIGLVDIALGSVLGPMAASEEMGGVVVFDEAKAPHLAAWAARFRAHDAVKEVMPETGKLVEFMKKLFAAGAKPGN